MKPLPTDIVFLAAKRTPFGTYGGSLKDAPEDRGLLPPGQFFAVTTLMVVVASVAFIFVAKRFEKGQAEAAASERAGMAPTIPARSPTSPRSAVIRLGLNCSLP